MTTRIEQNVASGELQDVELFIFTDNMVFESIYYKGESKIILLLDIVLRLHQFQIREELILHVVHISGTVVIKSGIDELLREIT